MDDFKTTLFSVIYILCCVALLISAPVIGCVAVAIGLLKVVKHLD